MQRNADAKAGEYERMAEDLIHFIVAEGLVHAECGEDAEHGVVCIWHESAVEHLAARLAALQEGRA